MYDQLLMAMGHYASACADVLPAENLMMWGFVFMSDWTRGIIDTPAFIEAMSWVGVITKPGFEGDYNALAACMVEHQV